MSETKQRYNNKPIHQNLSKKILLSTIDYLRYKVENEKLTVSEMQSLIRVFCEGLNLEGTADDFAEFFGKSKNNVKVAICRNMMDKPIRKVLYPFSKFLKIIPRTWYDGIDSQI